MVRIAYIESRSKISFFHKVRMQLFQNLKNFTVVVNLSYQVVYVLYLYYFTTCLFYFT